MRTCREVSELVSQALDRRLRARERAAVRLHLLICRACARFQRQMQFLHAAARLYATHGLAAPPSLRLRPQARERIRQRLAREV